MVNMLHVLNTAADGKLELITNQLESLETEMAETLNKTEVSEYLLSITGMGVVSLAACLGKLGTPLRLKMQDR